MRTTAGALKLKNEKYNANGANKPPEKILVRFIHFPVETLGPGRRVGVWTQGCSIRCEGCISPENQAFDTAYSMPVDELAEQIFACAYGCDGVTISGGEPFDQAEELLSLLQKIGQIPDILVYTGYTKEKILREHSNVTKHITALIDGEFKLGLPAEEVWKVSENQTLTVFRHEFAARYEVWAAERKGKLQLVRKGGEIRLIGIPRQEDLPALLARLRRGGNLPPAGSVTENENKDL